VAPTAADAPVSPAEPGDATWLHSSYDTAFWTAPGGDTAGETSASATVGATGSQYTWQSTTPGNAQMVADVQQWLDRPNLNFGWTIFSDAKVGVKRFGAREHPTESYRPKLVVTYGTFFPNNSDGETCVHRFGPGLPVTLPPGTTDIPWNVAESVLIEDLNVEVSLATDYIDGISLYLYSPGGNDAVLAENVLVAASDFQQTVFNDEAVQSIRAGTDPFTGNYRPETPLFLMDGEDVQGSWLLRVQNDNASTATLSEFNLCLTGYIPSLPHPADLNEDFKLVLSEAIGYLAGWQQGGNPIGHAIRAAYLWQNGEYYQYNSELSEPLCWELVE